MITEYANIMIEKGEHFRLFRISFSRYVLWYKAKNSGCLNWLWKEKNWDKKDIPYYIKTSFYYALIVRKSIYVCENYKLRNGSKFL